MFYKCIPLSRFDSFVVLVAVPVLNIILDSFLSKFPAKPFSFGSSSVNLLTLSAKVFLPKTRSNSFSKIFKSFNAISIFSLSGFAFS